MQKLSRKAPWKSLQISLRERQSLNYLFISLTGGAYRIPSLQDNHRNRKLHTQLAGGAQNNCFRPESYNHILQVISWLPNFPDLIPIEDMCIHSGNRILSSTLPPRNSGSACEYLIPDTTSGIHKDRI
ncbi:hypothetical protein TNCV_280141 [Trichonephila clavipes]|nr:hypothetical protein TNCV_280141 [Trichonephila clavipes]